MQQKRVCHVRITFTNDEHQATDIQLYCLQPPEEEGTRQKNRRKICPTSYCSWAWAGNAEPIAEDRRIRGLCRSRADWGNIMEKSWRIAGHGWMARAYLSWSLEGRRGGMKSDWGLGANRWRRARPHQLDDWRAGICTGSARTKYWLWW